MSGLVKAKKYDWKDSNMALFGSDLERQVKKESAQTEPAWEGAGQEVGLKIWRVVKFEIKDWPQEEYGSFYNGDSYIILNTYKEGDSEDLEYDVHFWIGKNSSQDEYGTAAYKTVELDTFLDDKAVQHREVQGFESDLFKSYFKKLMVMEGGAESGFRHVVPEEYKPRLLRFCGTSRNVEVYEVPKHKSCLNSNDVFILDMGRTIYQYNGTNSNKDERFKAMQFVQELESERGDAKGEVLEEDDLRDSHEFMQQLTDEEPDDPDVPLEDEEKKLYRLSDHKFDQIKAGDEISKGDLVSDDVFLLYNGKNVFVWVGNNASREEKRNGIPYAHSFLGGEVGKPNCPVTVISEGQRSNAFEVAMTA